MELMITFKCETCEIKNKNKKYWNEWSEDHWDSMTKAWNHLKDNPNHELYAVTDLSI